MELCGVAICQLSVASVTSIPSKRCVLRLAFLMKRPLLDRKRNVRFVGNHFFICIKCLYWRGFINVTAKLSSLHRKIECVFFFPRLSCVDTWAIARATSSLKENRSTQRNGTDVLSQNNSWVSTCRFCVMVYLVSFGWILFLFLIFCCFFIMFYFVCIFLFCFWRVMWGYCIFFFFVVAFHVVEPKSQVCLNENLESEREREK